MCQRWNLLPIPQDVIDCMNQLGKADGQPSILTFSDCKGDPVKDLQAPVDSETPTEIPGVQSTPPPTTKMMEHSTLEEPTIQVEDPENLTEPVSNLEDEDSTPPAVPDEMQTEDSIQSEVKNTTAEPKPENPKLDLVVQSKPGTDLNSDEEIQQPHRST